MKELTKIFNNISIPVEIIDDSNMYFTVSQIARANNKNITEWKDSKRVKELVRVLEKISVDFEIASNKIIMDIFLGEKHLCDKQYERQQNLIEVQKKHIVKLQNKTYASERGENFEAITFIQRNYNISMSTSELNDILVDASILKEESSIKINHIPNSSFAVKSKGTTLIHVRTALDTFDALGIQRDSGFEDTNPHLPFMDN